MVLGIRLNWKEIKRVFASLMIEQDSLRQVLKRHSTVFSNGLGTLKGIKARVTLRSDSKPKFCLPHNMSRALRPKVKAELKCLTEHSEWATPVVPVVKKDATVRLCGDFRVTINPVLCVDKYPIPRIEDLFACLAGRQRYSKLCCRLDLLKPSVAGAVHRSQDSQQLRRQQHSKARHFQIWEPVLVHDHRKGEKWRQGVVMAQTGPVSYKVNVSEQGVWKRHEDQMLARAEQTR